jgi:zinc transport system ATP-binding protein
VLLDEPVSGLDPLVCREMYALLGRLNREDKMTVVMVSHDIDETVGYANRILHIGQHGQLFFGSAEEYLKTPEGRLYAGLEGGGEE